MLQTMEGELLFFDASDVNAGLAELIDLDVAAEVLPDRFDPCGTSATWVSFLTITDLDEGCFFDWLQAIVQPLGGEVLEAGVAGPPPTA
jgi:hypothetical protein